MAYPVIRTDRMMGTVQPTHLRSVKYFKDDKPAAINNGCVVLVGDLIAGEREIYKATDVAADTPIGKVGLVATPELMYDVRQKRLNQFTNEADADLRVYFFHEHDIFSLTPDGFKTELTEFPVGTIVELAEGNQMALVASTAGGTQIGKVIATEVAGAYTYVVVQVG